MKRMNTNNISWSYFWSAITGFFTMLTLQDVLFAAGAVVTALFTWLTYRSNNRRNLAAIEEEKKRTEIIRDAYSVKSPTVVAARSDDIAAHPQEQ